MRMQDALRGIRQSGLSGLVWVAALAGTAPAWANGHGHGHGHVHAQTHGHGHESQAPVQQAHSHDHLPRTPEQAQRLKQAEQALQQLDARHAIELFEQAARAAHATDIELGLVRAYMQAGDYRRAITFGAHTAGAHGQHVEGAALYAWLLHLGGQRAYAQQVLQSARQRVPQDPLLADTRQALASPWPRPTAAMMAEPVRMAPYAAPMPPKAPNNSPPSASGLVVDQGRQVLAPCRPAPDAKAATAITIRNGMGLTATATLAHCDSDLAMGLYKLAQAMPVDQDLGYELSTPTRDPFPGSPVTMVEFAPAPPEEAAWPILTQGFAGAPEQRTGLRHLGINVPHGPRGGPVFNGAGQLAGVAVARPLLENSSPDWMVPISRLKRAFGDIFGDTRTTDTRSPMPLDEVYERTLRMTVQVMELL